MGHPQGVGSEGQIIVPGKDGEKAVLLIEKIVVPGVPHVTVPIHNEHLDHKVPQRLVHLDGGGQVFSAVQGL